MGGGQRLAWAMFWGAVAMAGACRGFDPVPSAGTGSSDDGSDESAMPSSSTSSGDGTDHGDGMADSTGDDPVPPTACAQGFPIPATEQVPGDPVAGYDALLNEGYVTCGIPYALFPLAQQFLGAANGEPLPGRTGHNAEIPYSWTAHISSSGAEIVSLNCLECHAGQFNGELIVGLGKADADYTGSIGGALAQIPIPGIPLPGLQELTRMAQRYQAVEDDIRMLTVGTNPADRLAVVLASHRNAETLEWIDEPHTPVPEVVLAVDTPPWWHLKKKNGLFFNGMSRGDHRSTMVYATSLCTDTVDEATDILAYFNDIRAYIETIEAPSYPFEIDEALAAEGETVFAQDCACCHGTYSDDPALESYPNLLLPLDVIGTDPTVAQEADNQPFATWFNSSWYGEISPLTPGDPTPGYVAPPLDGIWATAPYFHNASVPTIELVLDSTARPQWWRRVDYDSTNFDEDAVGWPYIETPYGQEDAPEDERKHVYDTTRLAHWNTGHTFGDHLSADERRAVIEYLKTL